MSKIKIFNDPIYGFILIPEGLLTQLIDHPWFQRLRRIKQLGLSHYVYPGAVHTRFHHALGAYHLMTKSLEILKLKGNIISHEEYEAAQIAALLHDIGHGPFSHVLEHTLVPVDHEVMTLHMMQELNTQFDGKLSVAIEIFTGKHLKSFLCKLVAGQLDVDRMDYLNRDSFYTGVAEGTIGCERMLTMMDVDESDLVFEEKTVLSIENYLAARRLMYWQVYMHKTSLAAEHMVELLIKCCKQSGIPVTASSGLSYFLGLAGGFTDDTLSNQLLFHFNRIDDSDLEMLFKLCFNANDPWISYLAECLLNRKFFKTLISSKPFDKEELNYYQKTCSKYFKISSVLSESIISEKELIFTAYDFGENELKIRSQSNHIHKLSNIIKLDNYSSKESKFYITVPKELPNFSY